MQRGTGEKAFPTVDEARSPMSLPETSATAAPSFESYAMQCMELIGGNRIVRRALSAPGLDVWLESRPFRGDAGGDVHYFSICGSGRVTRLAIADVSGTASPRTRWHCGFADSCESTSTCSIKRASPGPSTRSLRQGHTNLPSRRRCS